MNKKSIYILGYSGHAYTVIDTAQSKGFVILGYFDESENERNPFSLKFMGSENILDFKEKVNEASCFPAIGDNAIREKVIKLITKNNIKQEILIHKTAVVNSLVKIKNSTLVNAGVVINSMSNVGLGCIINTNATIEHDCQISDYVHIAPGAVLTGNVSVGKSSLIGANSVIKENIKIGKNVTIGAGSVVLKNIPDNQTWVGNPAKRIK